MNRSGVARVFVGSQGERGVVFKGDFSLEVSHGSFGVVSAVSQPSFGIDGLEFTACVFDFHLPIDVALGLVDVAGPGGDPSLKPGGRPMAEPTNTRATPDRFMNRNFAAPLRFHGNLLTFPETVL